MSYLLTIIGLCLTFAGCHGLRRFLRTLAVTCSAFGFIFFSFLPWLGSQPASTLALRLTGVMLLLYVAFNSIAWAVLADTLISQFKVPYPAVDAILLGGRFAAVMKREYYSMRTQLRVEARGNLLTQLLLSRKLAIPLLVASFRHADITALALENRSFASASTRTTHYEQHAVFLDWLSLALVWSIFISLPFVLDALGLN